MSRVFVLMLALGLSAAAPFGPGSSLTISSYDTPDCTAMGNTWGTYYVYGVHNAAACLGMVDPGSFWDGSSEPTAQQVIKVDMSNTQNVHVYAGADKACQNAMDGSPMFSDPESLVLGGLNFGPQSYCYVYSGSNPTYSGKSFMITSMNPGTMGAGTDPPYFFNMFTQSSGCRCQSYGSFCSGNSDCSSGMCTSASGSACNNGRRLSTFRRLFGAPSSNGGCMICVSNSHAHRELNKGLQHHSKSSSPHGKATGSSAHHKG